MNPLRRSLRLNRIQELLRGRSRGHWLSQGGQFFARQLAQVPVAGDATLWKGDDFDALLSRMLHEPLDRCQVRQFVAWSVLILDGGDADVAHEFWTASGRRLS